MRAAQSIPEIVSILKEHAKTLPPGVWIEGGRYRVTNLKEGRHPTSADLDQVSTTRPIFIQDGSGHHAVVNSVLLCQLNITKDSPDPPGARAQRVRWGPRAERRALPAGGGAASTGAGPARCPWPSHT